MTFGEKLQILRKEQRWPQEELAGKIGLSRQELCKWELGVSRSERYCTTTPCLHYFHIIKNVEMSCLCLYKMIWCRGLLKIGQRIYHIFDQIG